MKTLKEIALELVDKYYGSETTVIWGYSGNIDRAIEQLDKECNAYRAEIEALSAQQWIPCSERLPEEFYALCCDIHGEMLIANPFECDDSDTGFSAESEDCYMYNCVAWMPLPPSFKEE